MKCIYCGEESFNTSMCSVKQAVKPKGVSYRWRKVGYCCDDCYDKEGTNSYRV